MHTKFLIIGFSRINYKLEWHLGGGPFVFILTKAAFE